MNNFDFCCLEKNSSKFHYFFIESSSRFDMVVALLLKNNVMDTQQTLEVLEALHGFETRLSREIQEIKDSILNIQDDIVEAKDDISEIKHDGRVNRARALLMDEGDL